MSTVLSFGADDSSVIDSDVVVRDRLSHGIPVASRQVRPHVLEYARRHVFQSRCRAGELFESCDCSVEVGLVKNLHAVDPVCSDRYERNHLPLDLKALVRNPVCRVGIDSSKLP